MYNNFNIELERNKMFTPPTIGLTSSIVNNKVNDMVLENNSKINDIDEVLYLKANKADVYNKSEIDNKLSTISKNI